MTVNERRAELEKMIDIDGATVIQDAPLVIRVDRPARDGNDCNQSIWFAETHWTDVAYWFGYDPLMQREQRLNWGSGGLCKGADATTVARAMATVFSDAALVCKYNETEGRTDARDQE